MSDEIYSKLREFMDTLPVGYPATTTGVEIKILKKLFSPEEAELTMKLKERPEDVQAISQRTGVDESDLAEKLEDMARKGIIFRKRKNGKPMYQAFQFIVGIYEFQLNNIDKEFCELFEEYLPYFGMSMASVKTKQMRVIPLESAIENVPSVASYNKVRDLVKQQDIICVQQCICRKEQGLLGNDCDKPQEVCLGFGDFAQYYLDNKLGRQITVDEALSVLDVAEEAGLVLTPTNTQKIEAVCCCCSCCCPMLKYTKLLPRPVDMVQSYYVAAIDTDQCSGCGLCIDLCPMDAIKENDDISEMIDGRCIGCGNCVPTCPEEAITMIAKPDMDAPPMTLDDVFDSIKEERGMH